MGRQDDDAQTRDDFSDAVNMTAGELEKWLTSSESKDVSQKKDGGESTGHKSGRKIIELLRTKKSDLDDDDLTHVRKVVGYVKRDLAQRPNGDVEDSAWRYSLMNWGHDPLQK